MARIENGHQKGLEIREVVVHPRAKWEENKRKEKSKNNNLNVRTARSETRHNKKFEFQMGLGTQSFGRIRSVVEEKRARRGSKMGELLDGHNFFS